MILCLTCPQEVSNVSVEPIQIQVFDVTFDAIFIPLFIILICLTILLYNWIKEKRKVVQDDRRRYPGLWKRNKEREENR